MSRRFNVTLCTLFYLHTHMFTIVDYFIFYALSNTKYITVYVKHAPRNRQRLHPATCFVCVIDLEHCSHGLTVPSGVCGALDKFRAVYIRGVHVCLKLLRYEATSHLSLNVYIKAFTHFSGSNICKHFLQVYKFLVAVVSSHILCSDFNPILFELISLISFIPFILFFVFYLVLIAFTAYSKQFDGGQP